MLITFPESQSTTLKHFSLQGQQRITGNPLSCSIAKIYITALLQQFMVFIDSPLSISIIFILPSLAPKYSQLGLRSDATTEQIIVLF
jgi:hypothetical protein